nr:reverse transcriptase domain-containing protein [Tanacetum cinerariifolium]
MATNGNGDPPVPDLWTMEELCQPTLNGRGGPIAPIAIQEMNFGLKNDMIQQVQNSCQFHGLPGDDANKHLDKFLHVTQSIKMNGVTDDALRGTFMKRGLEECYDLIKNMTAHHNDWDTSAQRSESSSSITSSFDQEIVALKAKMSEINKNMTAHHIDWDTSAQRSESSSSITSSFDQEIVALKAKMSEINKNMTAHHNDWDTSAQRSESSSSITSSSDQEIVALKAEMAEINKNLMKVLQINQQVKVVAHNCETCGGPHSYNDCPATVGKTQNMNTASSSGSGTLPSNTITNPKEDLKGITTRSGTAYQGPTIPTASSSLPKVVERETELKLQYQILSPFVAPIVEPVVALVSAPKPNQKPSIPYPSRLHDQKLRDKANDQKEKFFKIFQDLNFNISFADALIRMPKFGPTIKSLLTNKEKLFELARTSLNEHCLAVLLKKLSEKLGDPGKFLIPCDFLGMDECLALANLGAGINLMPLYTERALIDVYARELTLRVNNEAVTFNLDQTSRYSANYNDMTANRIDVIDRACEEYSQEVLGFFDVIASGNPTPYYNPVVSTFSPTLTPFGDCDFLLEEVDAFLALEDDLTLLEVDHSYYDTKGDILLFEEFLNDDPSLPPPTQ